MTKREWMMLGLFAGVGLAIAGIDARLSYKLVAAALFGLALYAARPISGWVESLARA